MINNFKTPINIHLIRTINKYFAIFFLILSIIRSSEFIQSGQISNFTTCKNAVSSLANAVIARTSAIIARTSASITHTSAVIAHTSTVIGAINAVIGPPSDAIGATDAAIAHTSAIIAHTSSVIGATNDVIVCVEKRQCLFFIITYKKEKRQCLFSTFITTSPPISIRANRC